MSDSSTPPALPFTELQEIRSSYCLCSRDWNWKARLKDYDLWFVLAGKGELIINKKATPIVAPRALLLCPGDHVLGRHESSSPLEVFPLHFTPKLKGSGRDWEKKLRSVSLRPVEFYRELCEQLIRELARDDSLSKINSMNLAMSLIGSVWRLAHTKVTDKRGDEVSALISLIQKKPEVDWTLPRLALQAGMSATCFNGVFRRVTGFSPMAWVIRCRIEKASMLLQQTDMKLTEIANVCGYRDVYFFSRQFRLRTGKTPGQWRRS